MKGRFYGSFPIFAQNQPNTMRSPGIVRRLSVVVLLLTMATAAVAQSIRGMGDSWQEVFKNKKGTVTALWDDIEPFIYVNKEGVLEGVEYEIMESMKSYLKLKYGIDLTIEWEPAGSFDSIYYKVRNSVQPGIFGWSYFSITPTRQKEVQFSPPYMPDLNVLVTNNLEPMYASSQEFTAKIKEMKAYTMANTTMTEDVQSLKSNFFPGLPVIYKEQDYDVMKHIAADNKGFGYVPLSVYIVALQKGIKVKRQQVLPSRRQGFAAIMPLHTDWKNVVDEYFASDLFRAKAGVIVTKYLGSEVKDLVFENVQESAPALDLVSLEKEIVTKRLMDTAVEVQKHRSFRNIMLVLFVSVVLLSLLLYNRFQTKQKLNRQLSSKNNQIEQMNQLLKLKILQARMNPHFLFNSLNSIQYFITGDDKKATLQYIGRFSAFLRKVINFGDELFINVKDEAALLTEYLWLEHCRFHDKFEYEIKVAPGVQEATTLPLLTLGLVEEALYRGVLNMEAGQRGKLCIEFLAEQDVLVVKVTDNGITRSEADKLERRKGMLNGDDTMLLHRIDLFNAQSKRKITRHKAVVQENGTTLNMATLEIPQPLFEQVQF
ncbi:histidine kinase [Pseudoflavitalea sp. X16]|uniref:histidine kinase n=1 Tax=Paraflavitalea devenefica TaxID=2716334 RepID=UPI001423F0B6|nr:histidine kinase [Paraflavitalea devenefica]NII25960.1 histidine kinase [Paraflavitalea devenefica]